MIIPPELMSPNALQAQENAMESLALRALLSTGKKRIVDVELPAPPSEEKELLKCDIDIDWESFDDDELLDALLHVRLELQRRGIGQPQVELPTRAQRIEEVAQVHGSASVLIEAEGIVNGARACAYGDPKPNHAKIARLWEAYLWNLAEAQGIDDKHCVILAPEDAAQMMILLKIARLQYSPFHRDSLVDVAGYVACVERMQTPRSGEVQ